MARFTSSANLNIKWANHSFIGTAGTTHRVTDALVEEFVEEVVPVIPGFAWVTQDELTSVVTLPIGQTDVTGLTAALAAKYDKAGGTISGAVTVTGALVAQASETVGNNLNVTNSITASDISLTGAANIGGAATVTGTLTAKGAANMSSTLGVDGVATLKGAVNASSTLGVTGKVTLGNVVAMGGTAFPGSPANNDLYYRTDLDMLFFYDGTRWLCTCLHTIPFGRSRETADWPISVTSADYTRAAAPSLQGGSDIWLVSHKTSFFIASGGTALGASHKWVGNVTAFDSAVAETTIATVNIDSGSSAVYREIVVTIAALLNNGTVKYIFATDWTKTGTPGTLNAYEQLTYRHVAT